MKTISFTGAFALILGFASTGLSAPLTANNHSPSVGNCTNPIVRKEWRSLTRIQQKEYIKAVKCMQKLPAITTSTVPGALTRFDDFQGGHIVQTDFIHYVGQFLPWHRYFTATYEKALRDECGYDGGQPYWDWTLDYENWANASIWDAETGFGGNGPFVDCSTSGVFCVPGGTGGGCITDGPFKDLVLHLGPGDNTTRNDHCLTRDLNPGLAAAYFNPTAMASTMSLTKFEDFRQALEGLLDSPTQIGQHGGGHGGTGGTMIDLYASPGDPIFYLHHGSLDKLWWDWQNVDPKNRLYAVSGPTRKAPTPSSNLTLDYLLDVGPLGPQVPVRDVMDIRGSLCYRYE